MAEHLIEPANENPGTKDWQRNLMNITMTTGGLLILGVENMNNSSKPSIKNGTRFEINGSFYYANDEEVTGTPVEGVNYVYARTAAGGDEAHFTFNSASSSPASWYADKGGWYNGNSRAVMKFFYTGGQYNGKVDFTPFGRHH